MSIPSRCARRDTSYRPLSLVDDLDGSEPAFTHTLELDGTRVQIDLSAASRNALRAVLRPTSLPGDAQVRAGTARVRTDPAQSRVIRAWAHTNDIHITDRGATPPPDGSQVVAITGRSERIGHLARDVDQLLKTRGLSVEPHVVDAMGIGHLQGPSLPRLAITRTSERK